jgi:type I restriction enzyme S subunit
MRFQVGQVLYGSRRTYLRKVAVADFEGITANTTFVVEAKDPNVLLPELLPFIMQTDAFNEHSIKQSKGSVNPYINFSDLKWFELGLPPVEEQRSLVTLLQSADDMGEALLGLLECQRVAEAALFERTITNCHSPLVPLGSLLTEPPRNGCSAQERDVETGHWVLSLSAITRWGYRPGELKSVEKTEKMVAAILHRGDLVISRSNTIELVGLPATFDEDRDDVSRPDTMMLLKPDEGRLRKRFLELYLRSPAGRRQVRSFSAGTSASMKKINATNVAKLEIPLPSLSAQHQLEHAAESIRQGSSALEAHRMQTHSLRMAVLNEAMSSGGLPR